MHQQRGAVESNSSLALRTRFMEQIIGSDSNRTNTVTSRQHSLDNDPPALDFRSRWATGWRNIDP